MCQMSMKLPSMFDQNPSHTFDIIVEKQITKKTLSKLDLEPKCQGHSRNQKTMTNISTLTLQGIDIIKTLLLLSLCWNYITGLE